MTGFDKIAMYLTHPLVLVGFVLMLMFGVHKALIKSGIIPPLTQDQGSKVVQMFLQYGFVIGLLIMLIGFILRYSFS